MAILTGRERVGRVLERKSVDRIPVSESFWGETKKEWVEKGHIKDGEDWDTHFNFDLKENWTLNTIADINFVNEVIEETEDTILERDGNGALLKRYKKGSSTPEHVDFMVKDRSAWEDIIKPQIVASEARLNIESYLESKKIATENNQFFMLSGTNVFEMMHPVCGHENLLMGMALDPDWIKDMVEVYSNLFINQMEIIFEKAGKPDGIFFYEDMGFKERPFMSPDMYKELIQPGHKKTIDFIHSHNLPVIMHSCGFVEPLLPGMIEAGIDCLQAIEIKAGMDPLRIKKNHSDDIVIFGGMDVRNLVKNDLDAVKAELEAKIPILMENSGYILHSDHSIPPECNYETLQFFIEEGLKLGKF